MVTGNPYEQKHHFGERLCPKSIASSSRAAPEIFRRTYRYPQIKFSDIGRKCFGWPLRQAWIEARERVRVRDL
jgi:hypothetical protein